MVGAVTPCSIPSGVNGSVVSRGRRHGTLLILGGGAHYWCSPWYMLRHVGIRRRHGSLGLYPDARASLTNWAGAPGYTALVQRLVRGASARGARGPIGSILPFPAVLTPCSSYRVAGLVLFSNSPVVPGWAYQNQRLWYVRAVPWSCLSWPLHAGMSERELDDRLYGSASTGPVVLAESPVKSEVPVVKKRPRRPNFPYELKIALVEQSLPAGTLRLKGKLTPALLQTLIREMKGSSH